MQFARRKQRKFKERLVLCGMSGTSHRGQQGHNRVEGQTYVRNTRKRDLFYNAENTNENDKESGTPNFLVLQ